MRVEVSGVRVPVTEEVDKFIQKKAKRLGKYFKNIIFCRVILKKEKDRYEAELNLQIKGATINGKAVTDDLYASIEGAIDKVSRQSKRYKEKRKTHKNTWHRRKTLVGITEEGEKLMESPPVVEITRELAKPMGVDEAAMQLNLSKNNFLVFLNAETNEVNVIYKKENGHFGLIEPE